MDKYSNQTITLDEVGLISDDPLKCPYIIIDISTDFLASFNFGYNETGVYWMELTTNKNDSRRFGKPLSKSNLENLSFHEFIFSQQNAFVGLAGTESTESPFLNSCYICSLSAITIDTDCANQVNTDGSKSI